MKPTLVFCPLLITLSNAQLNPRAENTLKELEMPSELESLIESVELQASSVVDNIHSAYSHVATAVPTDLLTDIGGLLPTQTPASDAAVDGAMSHKVSPFGLTLGLVIVAVACCALG
jgi:hypothetical protein